MLKWGVIRVLAVMALLSVSCGVPQTAVAKRTLQPSDVAKLKSAWQAVISPDGQHIAYRASQPRIPLKDPNGGAWSELHVLGADGNSRQYIGGKTSVSSLGWTPDGSGISFLTQRGDDKKPSLYVIPLNGGEAQKVATHPNGVSGYSWHPNGKDLAILARPSDQDDVLAMRKKGFNQKVYEENVQPVQVWLTARGDLKGPDKSLGLSGAASMLSYSPNGKQLLVAIAPTPYVDDHYMNRKLHIVDAKTGKLLGKINNPGKLRTAAWSPNSKNIAVIAGADRHDPSAGRLTVVSAAGGDLKDLIPGLEADISDVAWLNDTTLLYVTSTGVETTVEQIGIDGKDRKTLIKSGGPILSGLTLSKDAKKASFLAHTAQHPKEVFTWAVGSNAAKRGTDLNPWLNKVTLGKQEAVTYAARDGLKIQGILIHPVDGPKNGKAPLIMQVHGGPEAHHSNGWNTNYGRLGQVAAGRGFAVFYPNYRASTGRGVKFSKLDHLDPAGKEFDDIVDGIDALANRGIVDKDKVGIIGGSYGGYAAAWGATYYSDRYAAACMFVGISDQISKIGTTDIVQEMYLVHFRKYPWEDWMFFLKRSPIYHAHKSKTPTLILHGENDKRVDPGQSRELYRHMKVRSKAPVRLIYYPGEGHGNRRSASRLDYNLRTLRWMEHYLKGPGGKPPVKEIDYKKAMETK